MKLRLRGDALRLRLSQTEVATFAETGALEDATTFAPGAALTYALAFGDRIGAELRDGRIVVTVPTAVARGWATNDTVGLEGTQDAGEGRTLRILVEKDFACLKPRAGEDDSDAYPHPREGSAGGC